MQFIIVMGVIFIMGFFLDFIEIAVVVVPITAPILLADPSAAVESTFAGAGTHRGQELAEESGSRFFGPAPNEVGRGPGGGPVCP